MTFLIALAVLSVLVLAWSLRSVLRDERGHLAPPASHRSDPGLVPPSRWVHDRAA